MPSNGVQGFWDPAVEREEEVLRLAEQVVRTPIPTWRWQPTSCVGCLLGACAYGCRWGRPANPWFGIPPRPAAWYDPTRGLCSNLNTIRAPNLKVTP